jgi:transcriptional regulator with XRE-family HTH domain
MQVNLHVLTGWPFYRVKARLPSVDKSVLGLKIQKLRKDLGLSQRVLAAKSGVAYATIQEIEGGAGNPTIDTLAALTKTLGTSAPALFGSPVPANQQAESGELFPQQVKPEILAKLLPWFLKAGPATRAITLYLLSPDLDEVFLEPLSPERRQALLLLLRTS